MISESEALERILEIASPLPPERLPVVKAHGRYAAESLRSRISLPRFDQSAMDGYAIRAADAALELRIVGEQPAGLRRPELRVGAGDAVRIFTGAPLPAGADCVVMQEDVERTADRIRLRESVEVGEFVRRAGGDLCEGQGVLASGDYISAGRQALLLSAGIVDVTVHRIPRIGILTSGDELVPPGAEISDGQCVESNGTMLESLLSPAGNIMGCVHCGDDFELLARKITDFAGCDALVLSGGVSVGDHDPVHDALAHLGAETIFWKIDLKPGKPFLFARLGRTLVFGLPGNPVSSLVTATLFALPALRRMRGALLEVAANAFHDVPLAAPAANPDRRPHYIRGILRNGRFEPAPSQQSHGLAALAQSNAIARLQPRSENPAGTLVSVISIDAAS